MRIAIALFAFLAACGRGDQKQCDQACRNYAQLMYWKTADVEIANAKPDQRDALRQQKLAEVSGKIESGIDFCVSKCQAANNDDQIKCMIEAKTGDRAKSCTNDD